MKILTLSRNKLELAQTQMRKPLITIGRSPTCDVILRAPGIHPVHFIVEWIGDGVFDPKKGTWSIADVSVGADDGEGVILSEEAANIGDISFYYVESKLESSDQIGGNIVESMERRKVNVPALLEFLQVRTDSGAIEEVQHLYLRNKNKVLLPSREFKSFKVELPKIKTEQLVSVLLSEMPGAELVLSGKKISTKSSVVLRANDFLQVKWGGRDFYLRFVEEVRSPPIPIDVLGSSLLKKITRIAVLSVLFFSALIHFLPESIEKTPELPRIARIEVPEPPPQARPDARPSEAEAPTKSETQKPEAVTKTKEVKAAASSQAAAAKMIKEPAAKQKAGLNTEAPVKNINQVGLLGALTSNPKKGEGIRAEKILNDAVLKKDIAANDDSKIVVKNSAAGVLGAGADGAPHGGKAQSLGAASTTLSGISKADATSTGLVARKGGVSGFKLGTGANGIGTGVGGGTAENGIGGLGGGDFSVAGGGLDRETVKKIIASYRNQIRTCYERALVSNTNLEGRIVYKWQISPSGSVASAIITSASVQSTNLRSCVQGIIENMVFPKAPNGLPTTVIYPFVFQGKN